jgi:Exonuclease VII, large subunit
VTDLAWLNDMDLAKLLCQSPVPIFTGIGHERDNTILDEIAHTRFDTPSKVALHISTTIKDNALAAIQAWERINALVGRIILREKTMLTTQADRIGTGVGTVLRRVASNQEAIELIRAAISPQVREATIALETGSDISSSQLTQATNVGTNMMYTCKRFLLILALCLIGSTLAIGQSTSQTKNQSPGNNGVVHLAPGQDTIVFMGQTIKVPPAVKATPEHPDLAKVFDSYVADPNNKFTSNLPNPPGTAAVRAVLNKLRPVPQDRINHFAPLDRDPLSKKYPRNGWWIYVDKVELRHDGWIAEVKTNGRFDVKGTAFPEVYSFWVERYQFQNGDLKYLGGRFDPPLEAFRVPSISVSLK